MASTILPASLADQSIPARARFLAACLSAIREGIYLVEREIIDVDIALRVPAVDVDGDAGLRRTGRK